MAAIKCGKVANLSSRPLRCQRLARELRTYLVDKPSGRESWITMMSLRREYARPGGGLRRRRSESPVCMTLSTVHVILGSSTVY
jgi:hypothetical protein